MTVTSCFVRDKESIISNEALHNCLPALSTLSRKNPLQHLFITVLMRRGNKIDYSAG